MYPLSLCLMVASYGSLTHLYTLTHVLKTRPAEKKYKSFDKSGFFIFLLPFHFVVLFCFVCFFIYRRILLS